MAYCPHDFDVTYTARRNPQGVPLIEASANRSNNAGDNFRRFHYDQARDTWFEEQLVDNLSSSMDENPTPTTSTQRDRSNVSGLTGWLLRQYQSAWNGVDKRQAAWDSAVHQASNTTVNDRLGFAGLTGWFKKTFADANTDMDIYAVGTFGTKGQFVSDNPMVGARLRMEANIAGLRQKYDTMDQAIKKEFMPLYKQSGATSIEEFLSTVGHVQNFKHAPSRNAEALARWNKQLADPKLTDRQRTQLETQIADLERNLDNMQLVSAQGTPLDKIITGAGYTNGQAQAELGRALQFLGMTEAQLAPVMQRLREMQQRITLDLTEVGIITPEQIAAMPKSQEFQDTYVPMLSKKDNITGILNDSNVFNAGSYHAFAGMDSPPDSAYLSLLHYARKAAVQQGSQEFGTVFAASHDAGTRMGRNTGIQMVDYDQLMARKFGGDEYQRQGVARIEERGGIVVDTPVRDEAGNITGTKRYLYQFDPEYRLKGTKITGQRLNDALSSNVKAISNGVDFLRSATSKFGQGVTRFNPGFAPGNFMADTFERAFNISSREFYSESTGQKIAGYKLLPFYLANAPRTGQALMRALQGKLDSNSAMGKYFTEWREAGLHQQYVQAVHTPRMGLAESIEAAQRTKSQTRFANKIPGLKATLDTTTAAGKRGLDVLDSYNDFFNNAAVFNQYVTLREAGVSAKHATQATLDNLNLRTTGTLTPLLTSIFPFVKPTVQTAVGLARALSLAPNAQGKFQFNTKGALTMMGGFVAVNALLPLLRESLGTDPESGIDRIDTIRLSELQRALPLGISDDGDYLKLRTGFGGMGVLNTIAFGMDRVMRGKMSPEDLAFETLFSIIKNVAPGDWPEFSFKTNPTDYIAHLLTPTIFKGVVLSTDWTGRKIDTSDAESTKTKAEQGRLGTEVAFHKWAKMIHGATGINLAPEQVKNIVNYYGVGPVRILSNLLVGDDSARAGFERTTTKDEMGPWLHGLGAGVYYGRTYDAGKSAYYQAERIMVDRIRDAGIPDFVSASYGNDIDKKIEHQTKLLRAHGDFDEDFIRDWTILTRADKELRSMNSKFAKEVRPVLYSSEDSSTLKEFYYTNAQKRGSIFNDAVRQLSYWTSK